MNHKSQKLAEKLSITCVFERLYTPKSPSLCNTLFTDESSYTPKSPSLLNTLTSKVSKSPSLLNTLTFERQKTSKNASNYNTLTSESSTTPKSPNLSKPLLPERSKTPTVIKEMTFTRDKSSDSIKHYKINKERGAALDIFSNQDQNGFENTLKSLLNNLKY